MGSSFRASPRWRRCWQTQFGVGLADIGFLIGLYFTPGVALSLPGGAIGQKFGDKAHGARGAVADADRRSCDGVFEFLELQFAGRLIAGAGGVLLNVQMTKMVADWFAGKEIATAMAIFVNSWPAGVALSLLDAARRSAPPMASARSISPSRR